MAPRRSAARKAVAGMERSLLVGLQGLSLGVANSWRSGGASGRFRLMFLGGMGFTNHWCDLFHLAGWHQFWSARHHSGLEGRVVLAEQQCNGLGKGSPTMR